MERKFKLAIITHVRRHPEIWDFTLDDYKKLDVRLTAWEQIVSELQAKGYDTGDTIHSSLSWECSLSMGLCRRTSGQSDVEATEGHFHEAPETLSGRECEGVDL